MKKGELIVVGVIISFIVSVIFLVMWGVPKYRIYKQDLRGQADLREQEWAKKILVEEAKAKKESAVLLAQARVEMAKGEALAEVERSKGAAKSIEIVGNSLTDKDDYLRYLFLQGLHDGNSEVIYIPTEAGMPIMEAGKRK